MRPAGMQRGLLSSDSSLLRSVQQWYLDLPLVTRSLFTGALGGYVAGLLLGGTWVQATCLWPAALLGRLQLWRAFTVLFVHAGLLHVALNMLALVPLASAAERAFGSARLAGLVVVMAGAAALGLSAVAVLLHVLRLWRGAPHMRVVGASGLVFSLLVVDAAALSPGPTRSLLGLVAMPSHYYPWVLLLLWQLLVPGASFLGHLAGLLAGHAWASGLLWELPSSWVLRMEGAAGHTLGGGSSGSAGVGASWAAALPAWVPSVVGAAAGRGTAWVMRGLVEPAARKFANCRGYVPLPGSGLPTFTSASPAFALPGSSGSGGGPLPWGNAGAGAGGWGAWGAAPSIGAYVRFFGGRGGSGGGAGGPGAAGAAGGLLPGSGPGAGGTLVGVPSGAPTAPPPYYPSPASAAAGPGGAAGAGQGHGQQSGLPLSSSSAGGSLWPHHKEKDEPGRGGAAAAVAGPGVGMSNQEEEAVFSGSGRTLGGASTSALPPTTANPRAAAAAAAEARIAAAAAAAAAASGGAAPGSLSSSGGAAAAGGSSSAQGAGSAGGGGGYTSGGGAAAAQAAAAHQYYQQYHQAGGPSSSSSVGSGEGVTGRGPLFGSGQGYGGSGGLGGPGQSGPRRSKGERERGKDKQSGDEGDLL